MVGQNATAGTTATTWSLRHLMPENLSFLQEAMQRQLSSLRKANLAIRKSTQQALPNFSSRKNYKPAFSR